MFSSVRTVKYIVSDLFLTNCDGTPYCQEGNERAGESRSISMVMVWKKISLLNCKKIPVSREFAAMRARSGDFQRFHTGEFAPLQPFEKGAAGGRDIAELLHDSGHRERRH